MSIATAVRGRLAAWVTVTLGIGVAQAAGTPGLPPGLAAETFDAAWTIVRDTHFDPNLAGVDWDAVRAELRPQAEAAGSNAELRGVLEAMVGRLGQSHFAIIPGEAADRLDSGRAGHGPGSSGAGADVGVELRVVGDDVVVFRVERDGPAARAGVRPGWAIRSIDGAEIAELQRAAREAVDGSSRRYDDLLVGAVAARLEGGDGSEVAISFDAGDGSVVERRPVRRPIPGESVKLGNLPPFRIRFETEEREAAGGASVGVIRFSPWMGPVVGPIDAAVDRFRSKDGMVLDLRGNPGGIGAMVVGVAGHFTAERVDLGVMRTRVNELKFFANPRLVDRSGRRVEPFAGPLAILIDGGSASTSEVFAAGLRDVGRARLFGERTAGAALPALMDRLPNGDVLYHAIADYRSASGALVEGAGVEPHETVPLTREALLAGRDDTMDAALRWIAGEVAGARGDRDEHAQDVPSGEDARTTEESR